MFSLSIYSLKLESSSLRWQGGDPISICSDPCPIGHIRNFQDQCCWRCVKCAEDAFVSNDTCKSCDPGHAPNEFRNNCTKLSPEIIDWISPWALVPLIFSSIGIFCTIFTTCVFIRQDCPFSSIACHQYSIHCSIHETNLSSCQSRLPDDSKFLIAFVHKPQFFCAPLLVKIQFVK